MRQDGKKLLIQINSHRAWLMWLASSGVNANSSNANFGPGNVLAVRPVDSIHCGYMLIYHIRDNIETNRSPLTYICYK